MEITFTDIELYVFFYLCFQRKSRFQWRRKQKAVIVEEEQGCIDIDNIGNLEDSLRLVFIDEECGNPRVVDWWWRAY